MDTDTIFIVKTSELENEEIQNLLNYVSLEKRNKINKMLRKTDKIQTLISEILVRSKLIEKFNIENKNIDFCENIYGKKRVKGFDEFSFNVSHSGEYVVVGISVKDIGLDIEQVKEIEYEDIAKSFFTNEELVYIKGIDKQKQLDRFYEIWTLKEAYIKNRGVGLSMPLNSFNIKIKNRIFIDGIDRNLKERIIFNQIDILNGYKLAICRLENNNLNVLLINQKKLIFKFLNLVKGEISKI